MKQRELWARAANAGLAAVIATGAALAASEAGAGTRLDQQRSRELNCLALSIYHEARNQPLQGQLAVAHVVLNRLEAAPSSTICDIVYKPAEFSWTSMDVDRQRPTETRAWAIARWVAEAALADPEDDPVAGSTYFHAVSVSPRWAPAMIRVAQIGDHVFYVRTPKPKTGPYVHLAD
jgi:spore germination cell wall hydrolase CwlJ-like protein